MHKGAGEIRERAQLLFPLLSGFEQLRQQSFERWPVRTAMAVPGMPKSLQPAPGGMARKKGVELDHVRVVGLGIDMPDKGFGRPLRAYEGILAAHEVQVAGP